MFGEGAIVVALDEEGRAIDAFHEAISLGGAMEQPVHAIHVVDTGGFFSVLGALNLKEELLPKLATQVRKWAEESLPEGARPPELEVLLGHPIQVLLQRAASLDASMIVVGGHASRLLRGSSLGTTARRLVRASDRPVLVRREARTGGPILVPVDLSDESITALELGARMANLRGVPLLTLNVQPSTDFTWMGGADVRTTLIEHQTQQVEAYQEMVKRVIGEGAEVLVDRGDPRSLIAQHAKARGVDLIVMGTHGRTGLARWSLGSVTEHLLSHTDCSVLAIKKSDRGFLMDTWPEGDLEP